MPSTVAMLSTQRQRALWSATLALVVCVAVWVVFSIVGLELQRELGLSNTQYGLLVAVPILTGSLSRLALGICAEMFSARRVMSVLMLVVAGFAFVLPLASSYSMLLLLGLGLGLAGGAFAVGVVYVSACYPPEKQGMALGLFGMGNVGTAATSLVAPLLLLAMDWQQVVWVYATVVLVSAVLFYLLAPQEPVVRSAASAYPSVRERLDRCAASKCGVFLCITFWCLVALWHWPLGYRAFISACITLIFKQPVCWRRAF